MSTLANAQISPAEGVDNKVDNDFSFHTLTEVNPWFAVDFGAVQKVWTVAIVNWPTAVYSKYMTKFIIFVVEQNL